MGKKIESYVVVRCPECARPRMFEEPIGTAGMVAAVTHPPCDLCRDLGYVRVASRHLNVVRPSRDGRWLLEDSLVSRLGDLAPEEADALDI